MRAQLDSSQKRGIAGAWRMGLRRAWSSQVKAYSSRKQEGHMQRLVRVGVVPTALQSLEKAGGR